MSVLDMEQICRLCCTIRCRMRSLFEQNEEHPLSLSQVIYAVAQLEVDPNDGMPQKICSQCATNLLKIYKTIESYWENDMKLRKQLNQTKPDDMDKPDNKDTPDDKDKVEAEEIYLKQELVVEDCNESEALNPEPMNDTAEEQIDAAADVDESKPAELNICIKVEPLDIHNEETQITAPNQIVTIPYWKPTAVQETEPIPKKKRGRPSKVDKRKPTELNIGIKKEPLDEHAEDSHVTVTKQNVTAVQASEPIPKRKRGRPCSKVVDPKRPKLHDHKCYICKSESFGTAVALLAHLTSSHENQLPFTCPECVMETVVLDTLLTLNVHMRRHLNPEKCQYCDKRYLTKYKVAIHVQQQHPSFADESAQCPATCNQCDEVFPSKVSLKQHVKRVHTASTTVSCAACGEAFNGRAKLNSHIQKQHGQSSKQFECNICQKKLTSLKILQSHMKTFHSTLNHEFKCSYCPKAYSTKFSRQVHEKSHSKHEEKAQTKSSPVVQVRGGRRSKIE